MKPPWLLAHIGTPVASLLATAPFSSSKHTVYTEHESDVGGVRVDYEFDALHVVLVGDEVGNVATIFLFRGADAPFTDVPFETSRADVRSAFGSPSKSGAAAMIPGLGQKGPWDRFTLPAGTLHFEYRLDLLGIELITMMRSDLVPG